MLLFNTLQMMLSWTSVN